MVVPKRKMPKPVDEAVAVLHASHCSETIWSKGGQVSLIPCCPLRPQQVRDGLLHSSDEGRVPLAEVQDPHGARPNSPPKPTRPRAGDLERAISIQSPQPTSSPQSHA